LGRGARLQARVRDGVELLITRARRLVPRFGIVRWELHVLEPLGKVRAETPGDEVTLVAADLGEVVRAGAAPIRAADARAVPQVHGDAAPQKDALEALAAVPPPLPGDRARAVPHQEIHCARACGNLILDHAVIAAQRSAR